MNRLCLHAFREPKAHGKKVPLYIHLTVDGVVAVAGVTTDYREVHGWMNMDFQDLAHSVKATGMYWFFDDWWRINEDGYYDFIEVRHEGDTVIWVTNPDFYPREIRFDRRQYGAAILRGLREIQALVGPKAAYSLCFEGQAIATVNAAAASLEEFAPFVETQAPGATSHTKRPCHERLGCAPSDWDEPPEPWPFLRLYRDDPRVVPGIDGDADFLSFLPGAGESGRWADGTVHLHQSALKWLRGASALLEPSPVTHVRSLSTREYVRLEADLGNWREELLRQSAGSHQWTRLRVAPLVSAPHLGDALTAARRMGLSEPGPVFSGQEWRFTMGALGRTLFELNEWLRDLPPATVPLTLIDSANPMDRSAPTDG